MGAKSCASLQHWAWNWMLLPSSRISDMNWMITFEQISDMNWMITFEQISDMNWTITFEQISDCLRSLDCFKNTGKDSFR